MHLLRYAFVRAACAVVLAAGAGVAQAQVAEAGQLAVAELRVGIERLAKLRFERDATEDPERARRQLSRERDRVVAALQVLLADKELTLAQRGRLLRLAEGVGDYADQRVNGAAPDDLYRESEAWVARLTFISTALSTRGEASVGAVVDLVTRAAATAQRVGKIRLARAAGLRAHALDVDAAQSLIEFRSALEAIGGLELDDATRQELTLAQHQWILLGPALADPSGARDRVRLHQVATTTDRIAESLLALARRALRTRAVAATGRS